MSVRILRSRRLVKSGTHSVRLLPASLAAFSNRVPQGPYTASQCSSTLRAYSPDL